MAYAKEKQLRIGEAFIQTDLNLSFLNLPFILARELLAKCGGKF